MSLEVKYFSTQNSNNTNKMYSLNIHWSLIFSSCLFTLSPPFLFLSENGETCTKSGVVLPQVAATVSHLGNEFSQYNSILTVEERRVAF